MPAREQKELAKKTGLDLLRLERTHARQLKDEQRRAAKQRQAGIRQTGAAAKLLRTRVPVFTDGVLSTDGGVSREWVDAPILIWPTPGLLLDESAIHSHNSFAKVHFHRGNGDWSELLSFFFRWRNQNAFPVTITANAYPIFNGVAEGHVDGGWYLEQYNQVAWAVYAMLSVYREGEALPAFVGSAPTETAVGMLLGGSDFFFHQPSVTRPENVFRGYDMATNSIAVPANGSVLLVLEAKFRADVEGGYVDAEFSSGAASISTPGILVTIWG